MKRLSFGRQGDRCYFWLAKTDKLLKKSTCKWSLPLIGTEEILDNIESFSDWFPKRHNSRIWIVRTGRGKDNPAMRLAYIRHPNPQFMGPRNDLLTFDEAYALWCAHIRFIATAPPSGEN